MTLFEAKSMLNEVKQILTPECKQRADVEQFISWIDELADYGAIWTAIIDCLPPRNTDVLIKLESGDCMVASLDKHNKWFVSCGENECTLLEGVEPIVWKSFR